MTGSIPPADTFKADLDAAVTEVEAAHDDLVAKSAANDAATAAAAQAASDLQSAKARRDNAVAAVQGVLGHA